VNASARIRFLRVSPFKVRRYTRPLEGQSIDRARAMLGFQPSPTCRDLLKLLDSAVANAENNLEMDPELMVVSRVQVDGGPNYRRVHPRARGRAYRIVKRTSHVTIELDLRPELRRAAVEAPAAKPAPRRRGKATPAKRAPAAATREEGARKVKEPVLKGKRVGPRFRARREAKKPSAPGDRRRAVTPRPMREKGGG